MTDSKSRWAWQNPHVTKKIPEDERIDQPKRIRKRSRPKKSVESEEGESAASDGSRLRIRRPVITLNRALSTLYLLLCSPSFIRLPIAVRFFCSDVQGAWFKYSKKAGCVLRPGPLIPLEAKRLAEPTDADEQSVILQAGKMQEFAASGGDGVEALNVTYSGLRSHVEKGISLVAEQGTKRCSVCADQLDIQSSIEIICPSEGCRAISHMTCLARECSKDQLPSGSLLPMQSRCPQCHKEHRWIDLVQELSLRVRGESDIAQLMRVSGVRKAKAAGDESLTKVLNAVNGSYDVAENNQSVKNVMMAEEILTMDVEDDPLPDNWHELEIDSDDQSVNSTDTGVPSHRGIPVRPIKQRKRLPVVIEDSEWDSAEVLD